MATARYKNRPEDNQLFNLQQLQVIEQGVKQGVAVSLGIATEEVVVDGIISRDGYGQYQAWDPSLVPADISPEDEAGDGRRLTLREENKTNSLVIFHVTRQLAMTRQQIEHAIFSPQASFLHERYVIADSFPRYLNDATCGTPAPHLSYVSTEFLFAACLFVAIPFPEAGGALDVLLNYS